jgi:hypothetical protein
MTFSLEENIKYMRKGSLLGLIVVVIVLFLSYYDLFKYLNINLNEVFVLLSWVYLILNIGLSNFIKYLNDRNLPNCPKCKGKLEIDSYKCKKCGKLNFERKKK